MSVFVFIAYAVVILTGVILFLSVGVVLFHSLSTRKEQRVRTKRSHLRQCLCEYLSGAMHGEQLKAELSDSEDVLIGVVAQLAEEVSADQRLKLALMFELYGLEYLLKRELKEISSKSWPKRMRAAGHLAFMGNREVVIAHLMAALEDEMLDVRLAAAHSLARLKVPDAVVAILNYLVAPGVWPIQRATEIITEMGEVAILPLLHYLTLPDGQDAGKATAIRALGLQCATDAVGPIIHHLAHSDTEVRLQSARALGAISDIQAVPALLQAMRDHVWEVRAAAAHALGLLKDEAAVPVLTTGLGDSEWWVRFNSASALSQLGESGIGALQNALTHADAFVRDISRMVLEECNLVIAEGSIPA